MNAICCISTSTTAATHPICSHPPNALSFSLPRLAIAPKHDRIHLIAAVANPTLYSDAMAQKSPENEHPNTLHFLRNSEKQYSSSHEAIQSFLIDQPGTNLLVLSEEEKALRESLKRRRKSVQEVLTEALRASKLSATFSQGVVAGMPEFIDHVMVKAAALKRDPELVNSSFAFRARVYIDQSGVTNIIKWLKHHGLTIPQIGKLVFLVEDYVEVLQPKVEWLKTIHVRGRDLGVVLTREPHILERPVRKLDEVVKFLESHGLKRDWIGLVVRRSPTVLALESEELQERVAFFTALGIGSDEFGTMVYNFPAVLGRFSINEMHGKVEYLKGLGLENHSLGQIISRQPQLLACSIEDGWKPLIKLFYYLGVDRSGLRRILSLQPSVFCLNLADNIAPKIRFLHAIGVHEDAIGGLIVQFPSYLSYSLDGKIRPLVRFLLERAGVSEANVGKVLACQPELISCSLPNKLEVLVKYFLLQGIRTQELGIMVADFPMLLKYSLAVIKPKLNYLKEIMARPLQDVIEFPRYFSYSLQSRIVPRHEMLVERGLHFKLRHMLACSDDEFLERVQNGGAKVVMEVDIPVDNQ